MLESSSIEKESGIEEVIYDGQRTLKKRAAVKRPRLSHQLTTQVSVASIANKVANTLIKECSGAITEHSEVSFVYQVGISFFVLGNNL